MRVLQPFPRARVRSQECPGTRHSVWPSGRGRAQVKAAAGVVSPILEARGGGKGLWQGKAARLDRRDEALAALAGPPAVGPSGYAK